MDEKTVNKLTGEPVSKEFRDVIRRLNENIHVSQEEINELPEIRYAQLCVSKVKMTNADIEERAPIQQSVFNRLQREVKSAVIKNDGRVQYDGEIHCDKRLDIVIGLPAAGKSSALAEPLSEFYKARIIDCDEAKNRLPGFDGGWGAGYVHIESQGISDEQFCAAIEKGENITYPRVGADCKDLEKYIRQAKNAGYKVYVHYNELDRNKALARMLSRFIETGRYLAPNLIDGKSEGIRSTYDELKRSCCNEPGKLIDGFSHWDNDVPFGERPILKECSESCVDFCKSERQTKRTETRDNIIESEQIKQLRDELAQIKNELAQIKKENVELKYSREITNTVFAQNPELRIDFRAKRDELFKTDIPAKIRDKIVGIFGKPPSTTEKATKKPKSPKH